MADILVVEDEIVTARDLQEILSDVGHTTVGIAHDAKAAISIAAKAGFDVALVDIDLAGSRDGIQLVSDIRRLRPGAKIIFVTSFSDLSTINRANSVRPSAYILKPFRPGSIHAALTIALDRDEANALQNEGLNRLPERITRVVAHIEAHLSSDLSLGILADIACLSRFHFSRQFREHMGLAPHAYVSQQRVEHAKGLIARTDAPLSEIAYQCGFSNQAHFTTVFGAHVGITPGRYRRSAR